MTSSTVRAMVFRAMAACLLAGAVTAGCAPRPEARAPSDLSATRPAVPDKKGDASASADLPIDQRKVDYQLLAAALFQETNLRRRENRLPLLRRDPRLDAAARMHATDMARDDYLSHTNPHRRDRRTPGDRAHLAGFQFRFLAENVATHFAIQYESGRTVYQIPTGTGYSYRPDGPPIPRHTYRSFAATLLDQWMDSPGHRRNILSVEPALFGADCRLKPAKVGLDKFYCVQLFGTEGKKN
mgnify:CR=1 FL=1